jgi:hypothetical protein
MTSATLTRSARARELDFVPAGAIDEGEPWRFVVLEKAADAACYVLLTAYIGHRSELEPWDEGATAESRQFWATHALIWESEPIIEGTETTVCPW